jgi:hypothetical protein
MVGMVLAGLLVLSLGGLGGRLPGAGLSAQEVARPQLVGTVTRGASEPVPGLTVVLHRVDAVEAGEIDSVRASPEGIFRFELPTVPDPGGRGEVYFASARHQGVLYFGLPITAAIQLDSMYSIQVYDTAVAPPRGAPILPSVRYILAEPVGEAWQLTDLIQLNVQGERTWVAADSGVTWSYPLPPGLREIQVGGGDVPEVSTALRDGSLEITAPLPPGFRQVVIRYLLDSLTVEIPVPGGVEEMDFLVRDPAPPVEVRGLIPAESVEVEPGVRYRRFAGVAVPDTVLQVRELPPEFQVPTRWLAVLLALLLAGVGLYAVRRPHGGMEAATESAPDRELSREELVREVAELDVALEEVGDGPEGRRLRARREGLVAQLRRRR